MWLSPEISRCCPSMRRSPLADRCAGDGTAGARRGPALPRSEEELGEVDGASGATSADACQCEAGTQDVFAVAGAFHPALDGARDGVAARFDPRDVLTGGEVGLPGLRQPLCHRDAAGVGVLEESAFGHRAAVTPRDVR